jgi:hypothetical protein
MMEERGIRSVKLFVWLLFPNGQSLEDRCCISSINWMDVEELGDRSLNMRITDPNAPPTFLLHRRQHHHTSEVLGDNNLADSVK